MVPVEINRTTVAARIRELRGSLSQKAFADRVGTSRTTVVAWEKGEYLPQSPSLSKMAADFQVNPDWILGLADASAPLVRPVAEATPVPASLAPVQAAELSLATVDAIVAAVREAVPAPALWSEMTSTLHHVVELTAGASQSTASMREDIHEVRDAVNRLADEVRGLREELQLALLQARATSVPEGELAELPVVARPSSLTVGQAPMPRPTP